MSAYDDTWFMRIRGFGDSSTGNQYRLLTRAASTTPSGTTDLAVLTSIPNLPRQRLDPLATWPSSGTVGMSMLYDGTEGQTELRQLIQGRGSTVLDSSGNVTRLRKFVSDSTNTFPVTDASGLSVGDYVYIGREVVKVTSVGSLSFDADRGELGSRATNHYVPSIGPAIYTAPAGFSGAEVEIGRIESGSESIEFRGYVEDLSLTAARQLFVRVEPVAKRLKEAEWEMPQATYYPERGDFILRDDTLEIDWVGADGWNPDGLVWFDKFEHGDTSVMNCTANGITLINSDDEWVTLTPANSPVSLNFAPEGTIREYLAYELPTRIDRYLLSRMTFGRGSARIEVNTASGTGSPSFDRAAFRFLAGVIRDIQRVEFAYRSASGLLGDVLSDVLTSDWGAGLPSEFIASDFSFDVFRAVGERRVQNTSNFDPGSTTSFALTLTPQEGSIGDVIRDWVRPLYLGIGLSLDGKISAVDWLLNARSAGTTLAESNMASDDFELSLPSPRSRAVAFEFANVRRLTESLVGTTPDGGEVIVGGETVSTRSDLIVPADISDRQLRGIEAVEVGGLWFDSEDLLVSRAQAVVDEYSRALPELTLELLDSPAVSIGDLVVVDRSDLPDETGVVGGGKPRGLVIEIGEDGRSRTRRLRLLLLEWHFIGSSLGTIAPAAKLTSSGTSVTIEPNEFTGPDATPGTDVESWGPLIDAGSVGFVEVDANGVSTGTSGKVTGYTVGTHTLDLSASVTSGNVLILDSWDNQPSAVQTMAPTDNGGPPTFLHDSGGTLGSGDDEGPVYS